MVATKASTDLIQPRIFALIVAINVYENKDLLQELHGCLNDARDFVTYLKKALAVPPRNILSLFNESATRENILAAFNSHLIHNDQISQGDLIFFYYAGHGDRVVAKGYHENGRMVETICPYDITVFEKNSSIIGNAKNPIYGIPDRTVNGLMRHLAKTKGDNIVSIFDCCHSGGIARGEGEDDPEPARFLSSRGDRLAPRPALPPGLDRELFKGVFDQDQDIVGDRNLSLATPPGFAYRSEMSHVLLAACQSTEKAREHHDSGIPRGRFTFHLLQILRKVTPESGISPSITYATLIEAVSDSMKLELGLNGTTITQKPHCEGTHKHRFLFSVEKESHKDLFVLKHTPPKFPLPDSKGLGELRVEAGYAHGVNKDTRFAYLCWYKSSTQASPSYHPFILKPNTISSTYSIVSVEKEDTPMFSLFREVLDMPRMLAAKGPMATIHSWGCKPMRVWYEPKGATLQTLDTPSDNTDSPPFVEVDSQDYADICCFVNGTLQRRDPILSCFIPSTILVSPYKFKSSITEDGPLLDAIVKFNYHLYRSNPSANVRKALSVDVKLHYLERRDGDSVLQATYEADPKSPDYFSGSPLHAVPEISLSPYAFCGDSMKEAIITDCTKYYGLTVINKSEAAQLYVYAFYFDSTDYSITTWYEPSSETEASLVQKDEALAIGYGKDCSSALKFSRTEGLETETGFLKIFVSNVYLDLTSIAQESPFLDANRGGPRLVKVDLNVAEWSSEVYAFTIGRESCS